MRLGRPIKYYVIVDFPELLEKMIKNIFPPLPPPPPPRFRKTKNFKKNIFLTKNFKSTFFSKIIKKSRLVVSQHPGGVEYRSCSLRNPFEDAKPPAYQWVYIMTALQNANGSQQHLQGFLVSQPQQLSCTLSSGFQPR